MKQILDKDWVDATEATVNAEVKVLDEGKNPRLITKVNQPAGHAFFELIEGSKDGPPLIVIVARADRELMTVGALEKAKIMVMNYQKRSDVKAKLADGVTQALGVDLKKGASA